MLSRASKIALSSYLPGGFTPTKIPTALSVCSRHLSTAAVSSKSSISAKVLTPSVGVVLDMSVNDLRSNMEEGAQKVHSAVMEHGVCFLRSSSQGGSSSIDPDVEDEALVAFAKHLGTLEGPHPIFSPDPDSPLAVVAHDVDNPPDGAEWHTDCSWR